MTSMGHTKLPPKLAQWQPILDRLHEVPPDRMDDEGAFDFILDFLEKRFGPERIATADDQLETERKELNRLAAKPGADPMLTLLTVWVSPHFAGEVSKSDDEGQPPFSVVVTLPSDLRRRDDFGSVYANGDELTMAFIPTAASTFEFRRKNLIGQNYREVAFERDNVSGWKLENANPKLSPRRYLHYFLTVPGGAVYVEVEAGDETIEIRNLESLFDGLSVQTETTAI